MIHVSLKLLRVIGCIMIYSPWFLTRFPMVSHDPRLRSSASLRSFQMSRKASNCNRLLGIVSLISILYRKGFNVNYLDIIYTLRIWTRPCEYGRSRTTFFLKSAILTVYVSWEVRWYHLPVKPGSSTNQNHGGLMKSTGELTGSCPLTCSNPSEGPVFQNNQLQTSKHRNREVKSWKHKFGQYSSSGDKFITLF